MMELNPPIIPGLTEGAEGNEQMKLLSLLNTQRNQDRKKFDALWDSFNKLFTPKEPPPEPPLMGIKPPGQFPLQPPMLGGMMPGGSTGQSY